MNPEVMTLDEVARFLERDAREVLRLASRGYLPGRKVGGQWRFSRQEITQWVEKQMHAYTETELKKLEGEPTADEPEHLIGNLLRKASIAVPLPARTRDSVLRELIRLAEHTGLIYDPDAILSALRQREEMGSTALASGVALPHPHRPLPYALGDSVVAFGRTFAPIPFGGPGGQLSDLFFLICCQDARSHLRTLARISRILLRPGLVEALREAHDAESTFQLLQQAERDLVGD